MAVSRNRMMYYHADAAPMSGHLLHPTELVLPTQASVSLGQAGGQASARVEHYKPHASISTGLAYSEVTGAVHTTSGNWTTMVTSTVEDVNLFGVVTADKIVSQIATEHSRDSDYPCVSFAGCAFENLKIDGKPVTVKLDLALVSPAPPPEDGAGAAAQESKANLRPMSFPSSAWPEEAGFVRRAVAQNARITGDKSAPQSLKDSYAWMDLKDERTKKGYIACSLVEKIEGTAPGSTFGHIVQVPGFGTVYLGGLLVDHRSFHLTMLRAELDPGAVNSHPAPTSATSSHPASRQQVSSGEGDGNLSLASCIANGAPIS